MSRRTKINKRLSLLSAVLLCFMFGGCDLFGGDSDDDNTALLLMLLNGSSATEGIALPKSIQTVPSESTASRANKIKLTQEDLR